MTLPFALPDWMPAWVPLALLVPALFYALVLLLMPFSVIGLKGRLDAIEARLDEIQGEIRSLALRMPEPLRGGRGGFDDDLYVAPAPILPTGRTVAAPDPEHEAPVRARPPIPPAPVQYASPEADPESRLGDRRTAPRRPNRDAGREARAEPKLDWPN
jgi:hypothetical protein